MHTCLHPRTHTEYILIYKQDIYIDPRSSKRTNSNGTFVDVKHELNRIKTTYQNKLFYRKNKWIFTYPVKYPEEDLKSETRVEHKYTKG